MGFGILFTGLLSMTAAVSPLSESETFANMFYQLSGKPVLGFLLGAGVAFLLQSSSATIGILQAIATTGALTFSSVYAIIIGVNIGDCVTTAIVCSIGSKADAKRTGVIHILFNIAGSILVIVGLMLLHSFGVLNALWDEALSSGGIANVHTVFRLVSAIVLLPVCGQFEKLSRKLVKDDVRLGENVDHELSLLDEKFFTSPAIALSGAGEAITTMARLARTGVMSAMGVLEQYDAHTIEVINENEEHIDKLADHVDNYLIRLSPHMPSGHGSDMLNYYIQCFGEFERIGDHAVNLTENAQEFLDRSASLSPTAHQELMVLREVLGEILDYTYKAFAATDYEAARHIGRGGRGRPCRHAARQSHPPRARRAVHGVRGPHVSRYSRQCGAHRRPVLECRRFHALDVRRAHHEQPPRLHSSAASGQGPGLQPRLSGGARQVFRRAQAHRAQ